MKIFDTIESKQKKLFGVISSELSLILSNEQERNKFVNSIWQPQKDPELYAKQQCGDTILRILEYFSSKIGLNFGVYIGNPPKLLRVSDFKSKRDFFDNVFSRFSTSHLYSGNMGLFKQVSTLTPKNRKLKEPIMPGDIICVRHSNGGYHAQISLNKSSDISKVKVFQGDQYYNDLRDKNGKFDVNKATTQKELKGFPRGFLNLENFNKFGGFGAEPGLGEKTIEDRLNDGDTIIIRRFNPKLLSKK